MESRFACTGQVLLREAGDFVEVNLFVLATDLQGPAFPHVHMISHLFIGSLVDEDVARQLFCQTLDALGVVQVLADCNVFEPPQTAPDQDDGPLPRPRSLSPRLMKDAC